MLTPPASLMIYVATQPVDFRKGAEGLALLAKETLGHDPMKGVAVVFRAKRADRVKIVVWDGSVRIRRGPSCVTDGNSRSV
jgi:transposase